MISWLWLLVAVPFSAGFGAWAVAICVSSARRREAEEYDLVLQRIAKAQKTNPPYGYCQTREHADRARRRGG